MVECGTWYFSLYFGTLAVVPPPALLALKGSAILMVGWKHCTALSTQATWSRQMPDTWQRAASEMAYGVSCASLHNLGSSVRSSRGGGWLGIGDTSSGCGWPQWLFNRNLTPCAALSFSMFARPTPCVCLNRHAGYGSMDHRRLP